MTLIHPPKLDVMTTCGANFPAPGLSFHFSSRGRNAKVTQYDATALVVKTRLKESSGNSSKYAFRNVSPVAASGTFTWPSEILELT